MTMCVERKDRRRGPAQHGCVGRREQQTRQEFLEILCPDGVKNGISWPLLLRAHAFLLLPSLWTSQGSEPQTVISPSHITSVYTFTRNKTVLHKIPKTKTEIRVNLETETKNSFLAKEEKTASHPRKFLVTRRLCFLLPPPSSSSRPTVLPPHLHFQTHHASK